jgi:hypothetical protein
MCLPSLEQDRASCRQVKYHVCCAPLTPLRQSFLLTPVRPSHVWIWPLHHCRDLLQTAVVSEDWFAVCSWWGIVAERSCSHCRGSRHNETITGHLMLDEFQGRCGVAVYEDLEVQASTCRSAMRDQNQQFSG